MATFSYTHVVLYEGPGDDAPLGGPSPISGTLDDGEDDAAFDRGDVASGTASDSPEEYLGTVMIDGQPWPAFLLRSFGEVYVYMSQAPVSLPIALQIAEDEPFVCFAAGTLIATPKGDVAVETLAIGDPILTTDGRTVPVPWVGRQSKHKALTRARDFAPVRVKAGALGARVPHSDLILTGDHALIVDGLAINAAALVNGTTIAFEPMDSLPDSITYYHIETENHEEILANGAPAETFFDYAGRHAFDNHQEYLDLYGCERIIPEMRRPRISARRQLPAATAARFGIAPFGADVEADAAALMARSAVA